MLTFEQIKELAAWVAQHRLGSLEIDRAGFHLRIVGGGESAAAVAGVATPAPAAPPATSPAPAGAAPPTADGAHVLTSPIVGTFYRSPSPDTEAFAQVGSRVKKGQVLCIVEAMKLMNEIESDTDGVVLEVYPKNAQPVEFGEPLFSIRPE